MLKVSFLTVDDLNEGAILLPQSEDFEWLSFRTDSLIFFSDVFKNQNKGENSQCILTSNVIWRLSYINYNFQPS